MALENFNYAVPWSKFKKVSRDPSGENMDAETVTEYQANNMKIAKQGNAVVYVSVSVKIFVNSQESWALTGHTNAELLKHEQGHYDISALAARTFYNSVLKLSAPDLNALDLASKKLNAEMKTKIEDVNKRYDIQTSHSRNKTAQNKWNKAIEMEKKNTYGSIDNLPL